jgi:hypothetical protein
MFGIDGMNLSMSRETPRLLDKYCYLIYSTAPSESSNMSDTTEQKEAENPDFLAEFQARLAMFKHIPEEDQEDFDAGLSLLGIKKLQQEIPAILFHMPEGEQMDIWIEDPAKVKNIFEPHDETRQTLAHFLGIEDEHAHGFPDYIVSATVLQDSEGNLYLLSNEGFAKEMKRALRSEHLGSQLCRLLERYNIVKMAAKYMKEFRSETSSGADVVHEVFIDQDIIGQRRINRYLYEYAVRCDMTITQFIRFRLRTLGLLPFRPSDPVITGMNFNDIAQEIEGEYNPTRFKKSENGETREPTPRPNLLDVVKIDGRWAQVILSGRDIAYLDDGTSVEINWDNFIVVKEWKGLPVWKVRESTYFTDKELGHIHWGPEQKQHPHLKEEVRVFGEYIKK